MSDYKFDLNPKEPSDEQITRHKDFNKVLQNYQKMTRPLYKTPLYKNPKIFLWLFLILLVIYLVAEFGTESKPAPTNKSDSMKVKIDSAKR
jgi:hypothetical protein